MRKILLSVVIFTTVVVGSGGVGAISEELEGAVSVNCASIMGQLKNVRYYDRKAREYLGNRYERLISGMVVNLNVRLVRNNISNGRLAEVQVGLVGIHGRFKSAYGKYATEMDVLMGMDCAGQPGKFYAELEKVRGLRAAVRKEVDEMNEGLVEFRAAVEELRGVL